MKPVCLSSSSDISRLENLAASLLPRWHFPMLNDVERNRRYEAGIEAAVREGGGRTVLDLGALFLIFGFLY